MVAHALASCSKRLHRAVAHVLLSGGLWILFRSISLLLEGLSQWRQLPTPSYCTTQLQAKAQLPAWMETGLPGDA